MNEVKLLLHKQVGADWVPVTSEDFDSDGVSSFLDLTNKPSTLAGYGILDAASSSHSHSYSSLSGKPTLGTLASEDGTIAGAFSTTGNFSSGGNFSTTGTFVSGGNFYTGGTFNISGSFEVSGNVDIVGDFITDGAVGIAGAISTFGEITTNGEVSLAGSFVTTGTSTVILAMPSTIGNKTYTYPTTSATLARTDQAQTFNGIQTFNNGIVASIVGITGTVSQFNDALSGDNFVTSNSPTLNDPTLVDAIIQGSASIGNGSLLVFQGGGEIYFDENTVFTYVDNLTEAAHRAALKLSTKAEFQIAMTDDNFATLGSAQTFSEVQTFTKNIVSTAEIVAVDINASGNISGNSLVADTVASEEINADSILVENLSVGNIITPFGALILSSPLSTTGADGVVFNMPSTGTTKTYIFPSTDAALARTDSSQTFSGVQHFINKVDVRYSGGLAIYGEGGSGGVWGYSESNFGVKGESTNSDGGYFISINGDGLFANTSSGANHAKFGGSGDNVCFIERIKAALGWIRGAYTGKIKAADTLTADRVWNLPNTSGIITVSLVDITYANLVSARNGSALIPGQWYRITDYTTKYARDRWTGTGEIWDTEWAESAVQPLIVMALAVNKVGQEAFSEAYPEDIITYDIDKASFTTTSGLQSRKGFITRRTDKKRNISLPYDYRFMKWNRYKADLTNFPLYNPATPYAVGDIYRTQTTGLDLYSATVAGAAQYATKKLLVKDITTVYWVGKDYQVLNPLYSLNSFAILIPVGSPVEFFTFSSILTGSPTEGSSGVYGFIQGSDNDELPYNNVIKSSDCHSNTVGGTFRCNTFGGGGFCLNTIGNNFAYNIIHEWFDSNVIGIVFDDCIIGPSFEFNFIGNYFSSNTVGSGFGYNSIGKGFSSNIVGVGFTKNEIKVGFSGNTIGEQFKRNIVLTEVISVDFNNPTAHVYGDYTTKAIKNVAGVIRLIRYVGDVPTYSDVDA